MRLIAVQDNPPEIRKGREYVGRRRWPGDPYLEIAEPKCLAHEACFAPLDEERHEAGVARVVRGPLSAPED